MQSATKLLSIAVARIAVTLAELNMNEQLAEIRPELRALKESAWAMLKKSKRHFNGTTHRVLLLLEEDCSDTPAALLQDDVLKPVDKIIWLLLAMLASRGSAEAYLPTLTNLGKMANATAPDTVWRAISILRCTRWITVCGTMWCKDGRRPSVYMISARPLLVAEALFLDTEHRVFLEKSVGHGHARVRQLAREALSQFPQSTDSVHSDHATSVRPVI